MLPKLNDPKPKRLVPVVILKLQKTYAEMKQETSKKEFSKTILVWYDIIKIAFPQWGDIIMGDDFEKSAIFVGDCLEGEK